MTRTLYWLLGVAAVLAVFLRDPLLVLLALLLGLLAGLTALWDRYALAAVTYERQLASTRLFAGEATDLTIIITNAKPLPLAWLKADDELPGEVTVARGRLHKSYKSNRQLLTNLLALRFYERVRKQYHLHAVRRGLLTFGPVELQSGDLFGFRRHERILAQIDELIVYPRVVPVDALGLPASYPFWDEPTRRRISDDPLRTVGTRPYAPGDNPRYLHWKATAHRGALQTKTFAPGAARRTAIFLDVQTVRGTPGIVDAYLEYAIITAASVARYLLDRGEAVGLYVNTSRRYSAELVRLAPARRPEQWTAMLEALARIIDIAALPFESFLRSEQPGLPYSAAVLAIAAVPDRNTYAALDSLLHAGHPTHLLAIDDHAPLHVPPALPCTWIGGSSAYQALIAADLFRPEQAQSDPGEPDESRAGAPGLNLQSWR